MIRHKIVQSSLILTLTVLLIFITQYAVAGYYEYDYFYTTDRMSREHRLAGDVDDWFERGNSTVTASPIFPEGIRLASWSSGSDYDTYEFGIASAVYLFEIPKGAQSIEIKVRYKGEAHEGYLDDYGKVAGRIWVRNLEKEHEYRYDRYDEEDNDTLYGDTFILRANRHSETIKIPVRNHIDDGLLELHVVAQNGELVDVNYIDVMAYRRYQKTRVMQYTGHYDWDPWYNYTYTYFYIGPHYYTTDYGYYVRWSYPIYDRHYIVIRRNYRRYLDDYRRRHGVVVHHYYRPVKNVTVNIYDRDRARTRKHLVKWTDTHEKVRHQYSRTRYTKTRREGVELRTIQTRVRQTLEKHRREPVLVDRDIRSRRVTVKQRRDSVELRDRNEIDERNRESIRTRINPVYRKTDNDRYESLKRTRTQPKEDVTTRIIRRTRKTEPDKSRRTEVKSSRTTSSRTTSSSPARTRTRTKTRRDDDDDDDEEEEEKRSERRENRKKRR
jgi:hypothetical protein